MDLNEAQTYVNLTGKLKYEIIFPFVVSTNISKTQWQKEKVSEISQIYPQNTQRCKEEDSISSKLQDKRNQV